MLVLILLKMWIQISLDPWGMSQWILTYYTQLSTRYYADVTMVIAGMKKSQKTITELCKYIYLTLAHTLNWVRSEGDLGGRGTDFVIMAPDSVGQIGSG